MQFPLGVYPHSFFNSPGSLVSCSIPITACQTGTLILLTKPFNTSRHKAYWLGTYNSLSYAENREILFSSVGLVKLIHVHRLCSSSKMHHILAQWRVEGIFGFVCAWFPKKYLYVLFKIIVLLSPKHPILKAFLPWPLPERQAMVLWPSIQNVTDRFKLIVKNKHVCLGLPLE